MDHLPAVLGENRGGQGGLPRAGTVYTETDFLEHQPIDRLLHTGAAQVCGQRGEALAHGSLTVMVDAMALLAEGGVHHPALFDDLGIARIQRRLELQRVGAAR